MSLSFSDVAALDRPLDDPAADTLGRAAFATRIARELSAAAVREPLVVALEGEPGSGKTTLKHFVRRALATLGTAEQPAAACVECSGAAQLDFASLARQFLAEIGAQLSSRTSTPALVELAGAWTQFAATLNTDNRSSSSAAPARNPHQELHAKLLPLPFPIVVFLDELEKLPAADCVALLRLIETLRFPRLVFVLLMHKPAVIETLARAGTANPSDFLRRVVHVGLELPEPPDALLRRQLEAGLEQRLATVTFPARPRERWTDVMTSAVWPLFSTPRDVQRFLAAFGFQFDGFYQSTERVLEVNPLDLVLLETLRMFAAPVYTELRDTFRHRETRIVRLLSGRDEERKEVRVEIDGSVDRLPLTPRQKRAVIAALQQLVPPGTGGVHGAREDWDRDLRFCSPRHTERYFHCGAIADAVPAHRLISLVRAAGDRTKLETLLLQAAGEQVLPEVLDRLPALIHGLPEPQLTIAAVALCGITDQIPANAAEDLESRLVRFACDLFAQVKNPLRRENIVAALLEDPTRLTGPILLLHALRPRSDTANSTTNNALSIEQFRRLIQPAITKLQEASVSGALWRSREAGTLIKRWWEWSTSKDEVQRWLAGQVKEPDHARAWLRTFLAPSPAAPGKEFVLQLEEMGQYCDPAAVAAAATQATGDHVDRAAAKRLGQILSHKGTAAGFALRAVPVLLEADAA